MSRVLLYFLRREGSLGGGGVLHPRLDSPPGHKSRQMRTLQHTATHSRTSIESLVFTCAHCNTPQHTATHCNTLTQHTATHSRTSIESLVFTCAHCNTPQHTATHCNTLQHTATHRNTLQHTATHSRTSIESLVFTCAHCNTLQRTATHCNTLTQHTATHSRTSLQSLVFTIVADEREYVLYGNIDLSVSVPHSPPFAQLLNAESHFVGCVFSCLCVHV